jgi:hypothetical protein
MKSLGIASLTLILVSCATTYQPKGFTGGYSSAQLDVNVFQVSFTGNGYTNQEKANDFALLRSAEVVLENGYEYFSIVDGQRYSETKRFTTPSTSTTQLNANTYGTVTGYGNTANYSGTTYGTATTTTYGGQTYFVSRPTASNTVVGFKEKPDGIAYNAPMVIKSLKGKYGLE